MPSPAEIPLTSGNVTDHAADGGCDLVVHNDLAPQTWSMHTLLAAGHRSGEQPGSRLWDEGHGAVWEPDARFVEEHADAPRAALLG